MSDQNEFTMPGVSSTKARLLYHLDDIRYSWLSNEASTEPPISIEVHVANACNLRCTFCSYGDVRAQEMLPQEALERLVRDFCSLAPVLKSVVFSGGGEPSLHPGLAKAIHRLVDAGIEVGIITNGVRVPAPLLEAYLRCAWIRVSLDTPDPAHYRRVLSPHSAKNFHNVLTNLSLITEARSGSGLPIVGVAYLIDRHIETDDRLVECLEIAGQVNADYAHYRAVFGVPHLEISRSKEDLTSLTPIIDAHAKKLGVAHQYPKFLGTLNKVLEQKAKARDSSCPIVSDGLIAMIAATGEVLPCYAHVMNARATSFGNIISDSFASIWTGALRQKVIQAIDAGNTCPFCRFQAGNAMLWNQADQHRSGELQPTPGYERDSLRKDMGLTRDENDPHWMFL